MEEIARFNTVDQAMMAKGMHASNGIDSSVMPNSLDNIFPGAGGSAASLYVASADAASALSLLRSHGDL